MSKNKLYLLWGSFFLIIFLLLFFIFKDYFLSKQPPTTEVMPPIYMNISYTDDVDFLVFEEDNHGNLLNKELSILDEFGHPLGIAWFDYNGGVQTSDSNVTLQSGQKVTVVSSFENVGESFTSAPKVCSDIQVFINDIEVTDVTRLCVDNLMNPNDVVSFGTSVTLPSGSGNFEIRSTVPYFLSEYGDNEILSDDVLSLSGIILQ